MSKIISKRVKFHWIHFIALIILSGYFIISKANLVNALAKENLTTSFFQLYLFGIFFACLFLFIFSHEKFFTFAQEMEKEESKRERRYLKKYIHHGKVLGTFVIGAVGGPLFASLTARLLLNKFPFKYLIIILANIPSTLFTLGLGHGIVQFIF